ncbi:MAG: diacylglycerol kinase family protein [Streptococcaceae bacterium]|jgi:undecaprenol kinase|nr:diacylglycerol kinase family protein [Streptococcaceae bacterium]
MGLDEKKAKKYKNESFIGSFEFAITGIKTSLDEEKNMKKHVLLAILAIIFGFIFRISLYEWLWILLAIFLVVMAEILNSVIENVVDLATGYHYHSLAKKAKDMSAGAVLLMAIFAVLVGIIIFLPKIIKLFS